MKIGVMFGNPETTTGGNALKFYASQRMDVRKTQPIKSGEEVVGYKTKIKIIKNKMAPPFREVELDLLYGQGFDPYGDLLDKAVQFNLIQKSGSWFSLNGEKIGQGREQVRSYLKAAPEIVIDLTNKVHACVETGELPIEQD